MEMTANHSRVPTSSTYVESTIIADGWLTNITLRKVPEKVKGLLLSPSTLEFIK